MRRTRGPAFGAGPACASLVALCVGRGGADESGGGSDQVDVVEDIERNCGGMQRGGEFRRGAALPPGERVPEPWRRAQRPGPWPRADSCGPARRKAANPRRRPGRRSRSRRPEAAAGRRPAAGGSLGRSPPARSGGSTPPGRSWKPAGRRRALPALWLGRFSFRFRFQQHTRTADAPQPGRFLHAGTPAPAVASLDGDTSFTVAPVRPVHARYHSR